MKNKIRKAARFFCCFVLLWSVGCVCSCSGKKNEQQNSHINFESNLVTGDSVNSEGNTKSVLFEGADLSGRVLEFSDTGFKAAPIYTEVLADGSSSSWEAAPGHEKEDDSLYVTYKENTIFEIVYFDKIREAVSSREFADKSSVKKQTAVYVFGFSDDRKNWIADKVLIIRWQ